MTDLADVARDLAGAGDPRRWLSELTIEAACGWRAAFSNQEERVVTCWKSIEGWNTFCHSTPLQLQLIDRTTFDAETLRLTSAGPHFASSSPQHREEFRGSDARHCLPGDAGRRLCLRTISLLAAERQQRVRVAPDADRRVVLPRHEPALRGDVAGLRP